jgi:3-isopropylmalate dehydrogenase
MDARIVLLPGDGIGPEVVDAAVRVLEAVEERFGHRFHHEERPIGGVAMRKGRKPLPPETLEACAAASAVLLGAVGDPEFDAEPAERRPEAGLLQLRHALGVYANLRPARAWPGLEDAGPIRRERLIGTDMLVVRELTGGLYFGRPRGWNRAGGEAFNTLRYTSAEVERVAEVAFKAARGRKRRVTSVDKANVLETSQLWRDVVTRVASRYPDVVTEHMYVDACAMHLVLSPRRFDVLLTENLFGDILSDEAGAIVGSIGLLPSASIGRGAGLFEPVHGSAPDLAGRNSANPVGAIASVAMMLEHQFGLAREAAAIEEAIQGALADGCRTADIAPAGSRPLSCSEMTAAIVDRISEALRPVPVRSDTAWSHLRTSPGW